MRSSIPSCFDPCLSCHLLQRCIYVDIPASVIFQMLNANTSFTILTHRTCSQARSWRGKCLDQGDELIISWLPDLMISVFHTWISVTVLKNNIAENY